MANLNLTEEDKNYIIQYVRGLLYGITLTENKDIDVLSEDYWVEWSEDMDINLNYNKETKNWNVAVYAVNELGQVETDDFTELNIYTG
jgi:hypothetical protein